jgi:hypothetical protein
MKFGERAFGQPDVAVGMGGGQQGGRKSHARDCSSLSHSWDLATMTARRPVFLTVWGIHGIAVALAR